MRKIFKKATAILSAIAMVATGISFSPAAEVSADSEWTTMTADDGWYTITGTEYKYYCGTWNGSTGQYKVNSEDSITVQQLSSLWYDAWGFQVQRNISGYDASSDYTFKIDMKASGTDGSFKTSQSGDTISLTGGTQTFTGTVTTDANGDATILTFGYGWVGTAMTVTIDNLRLWDSDGTLVYGTEEATSQEGETTTKAAGSTTTTFPKGYTAKNLVWSDEFSGSTLNTDTWNYETGNGTWGWGNNEQEYYTGRTDNVYIADISSDSDNSVDNSALAIKAQRESFNGYNYTSGRIQSSGKQNFKYGYIEAKIKMDNGMATGVWPAFWLLGQTSDSWPYCGEWDIMEHANANSYITSTLHWANEDGSEGNYGGSKSYASGDINSWHLYGMSWTADSITVYLDGVSVFTMAYSDTTAELFNNSAYMILNVAVGGNFIGNVVPSDAWAGSTMYVDYIRIYQNGETNASYTGTWEKDPFWENYDYDNDTSSGGTVEEKDPVNNIGAWTHVHSAYETADQAIENTSVTDLETGWTANITTTGWQGLWSAPADYTDAVAAGSYYGDSPYQLNSYAKASIVAGQTYHLGFDIVNKMNNEDGTATEKNVTITVGSGVSGDNDNTMVYDTITVPAGETYHYTKDFTVSEEYALGTVTIQVAYGAYSYSYSAEKNGITDQCTGNPYLLAPGTTEALGASGKLTLKNAYCVTDTSNLVTEAEVDYTKFNWTHTHDSWGQYDAVIANTTVEENDGGFVADISITGWEGYWSAPADYPDAVAAGNYYGDNPFQLTSESDIAVEAGKSYTFAMDITNNMYAESGEDTEKNVTISINSGITGDTDNNFVYETVTVDPKSTYSYTVTFEVPESYTEDTVHIEIAYGTYMYSYTAQANGTTDACSGNPYLLAPGTTENVNCTGKLAFANITFTEESSESVKASIDGYQINTDKAGFRTLYTVDGEVESVGLVYGLSDYATAEDMVVGSTNSKVYSYEATDAGLLSTNGTASTYAMTMKYGTVSSDFLSAGLMVRAYAKLADGSYVYSDVSTTSVYDIADNLYKNSLMSTAARHSYLYTDILSLVNKDYATVEFSPAN